MTFEQFGTIWKEFTGGSLTIVTAKGSWEVAYQKQQLSIHPTTQLFVYQEQPNGTKFIFDVSAIDHISYKD